jgi:catechol 2,3-dioxygenase-like lactoylglutathione lyase family enzyme
LRVRLDSVQIGVADIEEASAAYALLLGVESIRLPENRRRLQLARGAVELEAGEPGVHSIRFVTEAADERPPAPAGGYNGLRVLASDPFEVPPPAALADAAEAIDHVVVRTPDPDRAIRLWRDQVGLRLALDRAFPERGLRLVFFRSGGITLEFAGSHPPPAVSEGPDSFFGVSYRVPDLEARRERLLRAGLDVTPIRPGMRPRTSVATVRSGAAGVPTLLLQVRAERSPV